MADTQAALQEELDQFEVSLPDHLQYRAESLAILAYSADAHSFFLIRTTWLQCHCDLYRFFVPGIRESVSSTVTANTPVEYVDFCTDKCLSSALKLCDFWTDMLQLWTADLIEETLVDVSIYQVSQVLHSLHHLLPPSGPHCVESLKSALQRTLRIVSESRSRVSRMSPGLKAAESLVQVLGQVIPETTSSPQGNLHHLPSHGSLIPETCSSDDTDASERPARTAGNAALNARDGDASDAGRLGPPYQASDLPTTFDPEDALLGIDEHLLDFLPWTPISMSRMPFSF